MSFFEGLVLLLFVAVALLQVARRLALPYPAMLAMAGAAVAFVPGAPNIRLEPQTALALFIAPALLDSAFDFPVATARQLWRPLLMLAGGAVLISALAVAWIGWAFAGLPVAAALVLGAIVAPPDAAAAVAVLGSVSLPGRTAAVLQGESLFNDATALLLFGAALTIQMSGGLDARTALHLAAAAPGGVILGVFAGFVVPELQRSLGASLGGNLLQFLNTFALWLVAERLGLSPVLAVAAFGMTIAGRPRVNASPRMRVHSFAVWSSVVFVLNVLAFLIMGMQARAILERMSPQRLRTAEEVAALVAVTTMGVRLLWVVAWNRLAARLEAVRGSRPPPTLREGLAVGWSGMRGLVTLATAFALPAAFPQRDLVVLVAFAVVLATLVLQGLTLGPLIRLLKLDRFEDPGEAMLQARRALAAVALEHMPQDHPHADFSLRDLYQLKSSSAPDGETEAALQGHRKLGLELVQAQRRTLDRLRSEAPLDTALFYRLQEEIDWRELTLLPEEDRWIDEI